MIRPFPAMFQALIDGRFSSRREFVRAACPGGNEDSLSSALAKVLKGTLLPSLELVPAWADALGLTGAERDEFILQAELAHCPPGIRARMAAYECEAAKLRAEIADLKALINTPKPKGSR